MSSFVNVGWFLAIPFNTTITPRLQIAELGELALGDKLRGLEVGDQPDLYASEGLRKYVRHFSSSPRSQIIDH